MEEKTVNNSIDSDKAEKIYGDACLLMKSSDINLLRSAIEYFDSVPGYRDSDEKRIQCNEKINKIIVRMEKDRKYMKLNIAIICMAMITILALLTVFIITLIFRDDQVREFTQRSPVQTTQKLEENLPSDKTTEITQMN